MTISQTIHVGSVYPHTTFAPNPFIAHEFATVYRMLCAARLSTDISVGVDEDDGPFQPVRLRSPPARSI